MQQPVTRELFDYWNTLRRSRPAPDRSDLDPAAIRTCLADTFVLAFDITRGHPFRIAGTGICAAFGRELTGTAFADLWPQDERAAVSGLIRQVTSSFEIAVANVAGRNADDETWAFEIILLPLTCSDAAGGRLLGALAPVGRPYWCGERPLQTLHLKGIQGQRIHEPIPALTKFAGDRAVRVPIGRELSAISRNYQG